MAKHKKLPPKEELVIRSFGITDLRAVDEGTYIEGHPAVYDQITNVGDWFREVIERGAFNGCNFDDVLLSANHNLMLEFEGVFSKSVECFRLIVVLL